MSKFSVKKPFTILVMVITILILGIVSVSKMQTDLLPDISLPYIMVITTYPGASPEKVEMSICEPMESALGTISGVKNIMSSSSENYGLVQLEFEDDTNMDSAMVKVSSSLDAVKDYLPEDCGTPQILEISMDMMASQYLAVSMEGMTIEETSAFVRDNIIPYFERQNGVASVTSIGLVDKTIQIELNKEKVEDLNNKILAKTDDAFADALNQLNDAKEQLYDSEESIDKNKQKLYDSEQQLLDSQKELEDGKQELVDAQKELDDGRNELAEGRTKLEQSKIELEDGKRVYNEKKSETERQLAETETQLLTAKADLEAAKTHIELEIKALEGENQAIDSMQSNINDLAGLESVLNTQTSTDALGTIRDSNGGSVPDAQVDAIIGALIAKGISASDSTTVGIALGSITSIKNGIQSELDKMGSKVVNEGTIAAYKSSLSEINSNMSKVNEGLSQLYAGNLEAAIQLANAQTGITLGEMQLTSAESTLESSEKQLKDAQKQIDDGWKKLEDGQKQIDDGWEQLEEGWDQLHDGEKQIKDGWEDYYDAVETFEKQKVETLRHANADDLLSLSTLSSLIYAQNFEMPAGYIDDKNDNSWLLKVGSNYDSVDELSNIVLCNIDDIGDVRICDIANVTIIDNAMDSYARLNKENAVILSIFKSSTAGTNEVSRVCKNAIKELEEKYEKLSILVIMDQGDYITIIINSLLSSMLMGAALAIIILAIFLRDVRPTIVVALSIPLSVLTALVAMYFSKISLNMMSLSGLALGIGMLVDNSIVVLENIYRLRGKGVEAPRASVQGTNQVTGAIIASTLTTVSVYLPLVFTTGMVRDLIMPMSLSIIFCLMASLLVAMTLIPATCSTLLKKSKPKDHKLFDKIQDIYGATLNFCLKVKIVPIAISLALLIFSIWRVLNMGIVMLPEMTSNELQASVRMPEDMTREDCYYAVDTAINRILCIEGIESVGAMSGGEQSLVLSTASTETDYTSYSLMIKMNEDSSGKNDVKRAVRESEKVLSQIGAEEYSVTSSMMDVSQLTGSGLSIKIYGEDLDTLEALSEDIMDIVKTVDGFTDISNGQEEPDQVIHLFIDKDKAMGMGLSVAQLYTGIQDKLDDKKSAVSVNINGENMDIEVVTHIDPLTYENLLDFTYEVSETDKDGNTYTHDVTLGELSHPEFEDGFVTINRENQSRYITVSAGVNEGENVTLLTRKLQPLVEAYELPSGYTVKFSGEMDSVNTMVNDMLLVIALGFAFIYLVMVAQFQSLLSPFIVIFTVPLAFTGGLIGLLVTKEPLSIMSLMGFILLLGTVVNNGIVFVDYTNQLRKAGLDRHTALIATGKTRMRPILMTALTTILAMSMMVFGDDMGSQMGKGMAIVVAAGLMYATLMTLYIVPVMYDILYKKQPLDVDLGSENLDDVPDDAADYVQSMNV